MTERKKRGERRRVGRIGGKEGGRGRKGEWREGGAKASREAGQGGGNGGRARRREGRERSAWKARNEEKRSGSGGRKRREGGEKRRREGGKEGRRAGKGRRGRKKSGRAGKEGRRAGARRTLQQGPGTTAINKGSGTSKANSHVDFTTLYSHQLPHYSTQMGRPVPCKRRPRRTRGGPRTPSAPRSLPTPKRTIHQKTPRLPNHPTIRYHSTLDLFTPQRACDSPKCCVPSPLLPPPPAPFTASTTTTAHHTTRHEPRTQPAVPYHQGVPTTTPGNYHN